MKAKPFTPNIVFWLAVCSFYAGRYPEASNAIRTTLDLEPAHVMARYVNLEIMLASGREAEAVDSLREELAQQAVDPETSPYFASFLARAGREDEARRILARPSANSLDQLGPFSQVALARALVSLGEMDRAFEIVERLLKDRSRALLWINTNPRWGLLRSDPRFSDLLHKMGLPAVSTRR